MKRMVASIAAAALVTCGAAASLSAAPASAVGSLDIFGALLTGSAAGSSGGNGSPEPGGPQSNTGPSNTGPSTHARFRLFTVETTQERQAPTPHAIRRSSETWQGTPAAAACAATMRCIGSGPHT